MESSLQFSKLYFHTFQVIYFVDENQISWFRSTDIGAILNFSRIRDVVKKHVSERHIISVDNIIFVSEHGLFNIIMKSKCSVAAEQFRVWIFEHVLPSIRKQEECKRIKQVVQGFEARIAALESSNRQLQLEIQDLNRRYDELERKMDVIKDQRVVPTADSSRRNCLMIFKKNMDVPFPYFALRVQNRHVQPRMQQERRKYPQMERIFYTSSPNSINLFNRVKATRMFNFRNDSRDYNSFRIAATVEELISYIKDVHDERLRC